MTTTSKPVRRVISLDPELDMRLRMAAALQRTSARKIVASALDAALPPLADLLPAGTDDTAFWAGKAAGILAAVAEASQSPAA